MLFFYILLALTIGFGVWILWRLISNFFVFPCPAWLSWMVEIDNPFAKAHNTKEIINSLPIYPGIKILDIGCGPGRVLLPLAQKIAQIDGRVTGLDIQNAMIEKVKAKAEKLKLNNVDFVCGDIDKIEVKTNYNVILMVCVLGEIPKAQHQLVICKIANKLKQDGTISFSETIFDPHFKKHKEILELMNKCGFVEVNFFGNILAYTAQFKKSSIS